MATVGMSVLGTMSYDKLFAGHVEDPVVGVFTLLTGNSVTRGTCLGRVTASGKLKPLNSANSDGSQTIFAIAADDCDATSADALINVYLTGEFNQAALTFGGSDTAATHLVAARGIGLFFKSNVTVGGTY